MIASDTEDHLVKQTVIDKVALESRGWVAFSPPVSTESELNVQLLDLASGLGVPVETRPGGSLCDELSPTV